MDDTVPAGAISARELLRSTWRAFSANRGSMILLALIGVLPGTLLANAAHRVPPHAGGALTHISIVAHVVCVYLAHASITHVAFEHLSGRERLRPFEALGRAAYRILPVVATAVSSMLATLLGTLLFVVPGVIVWLTLFAAVPAAVVEHLGPLAALRRSADLTQGSRGQILVATLGVMAVFAGYLGCACAGLGCCLLPMDPESDPPAFWRFLVLVSNLGGQAVLIVAFASLATVFYARARGLRDGIDVDEITEALS